MPKYLNKNGNSPIKSYETEPTRIIIRYSTGKCYSYSYQSAGKANVDRMKELAANGCGLSAFISRNVRNDYEK